MQVERKRVYKYPTRQLVLVMVLSFILLFEFLLYKGAEDVYMPLWVEFLVYLVLVPINACSSITVFGRLDMPDLANMKEKQYPAECENDDKDLEN